MKVPSSPDNSLSDGAPEWSFLLDSLPLEEDHSDDFSRASGSNDRWERHAQSSSSSSSSRWDSGSSRNVLTNLNDSSVSRKGRVSRADRIGGKRCQQIHSNSKQDQSPSLIERKPTLLDNSAVKDQSPSLVHRQSTKQY